MDGSNAGRVAELVERLAATERELRELLGGDADAVITSHGETHLLRDAQEGLRHSEDVQRQAASLQRGILDTLPAGIALLDREGKIVTVNGTWARPGVEELFYGCGAGAGDDYLDACGQPVCGEPWNGLEAAEGIRSVLRGETPRFQLEYTCQQDDRTRWLRLVAVPWRDGGAGGAVVMHLDITEQMRAAEATRAGDQRFRALVESAADSITLFDVKGHVRYASPPTARLLGYDLETEFIGHSAFEFVHLDDKADVVARMAEVMERPGVGVPVSVRLRRKDGVWRRFEGTFTNLLDDPTLRAVVGNCRDVTEREEMRARLERLFETSPDLISTADWTGHLHDLNPAYERVLGYTREEIEAAPFLSLVHPDDHEGTRAAFAGLLEGRPVVGFTNRYRAKDGSYRTLQWNSVAAVEEQIIYGVARDITEQRRAGESLRMQAHMLDSVGQAVIAADFGGRIVYVNRFAGELYGWEPAEMLGRDVVETTVPQTSLEQANDILARLHRKESWSGEISFQDRSGRVFPAFLTSSPLLDERGEVVGLVGVSSDISARKQAEENVRQKDALIRIAGKLTRTGGWIMELPDRRLAWSDEIFDLLGYPRGTTPPLDRALVLHPEPWQERITAAVEACAREGTSFDMEVPIFAATGRIIWGRVCAEAERDVDGSIKRVQGAFQDITERRHAHAASEVAAHRLRLATRVTGTGVWEWDLATNRLIWDEQMFSLYGFDPPPAEMTYEMWARTVLPEEVTGQTSILQDTVRQQGRSERKFRIRRVNDGEIRIIQAAEMAVLADDSEPQRVVGINRDITDFEIAASNLAASEERFRQAFEFAGTGMAIIALDGAYLKVNRATSQILGYSAEELALKASQDLTHPDDLETQRSDVGDLQAGKSQFYQNEKRLFHRDGHVVWVRTTVSLVRDGTGAPLHYITQVEDISERKLAEAALREREASFALAQEAAGFGSWQLGLVANSASEREILWSEQTYRIYGLEPDAPVTPERWLRMVHPEDRGRITSELVAAPRHDSHYGAEHRIVRTDGAVRVVRADGQVFHDEHGQAVKMVGVVQDITERKAAEEARERLAVIVESSGDAILSNDLENIITSWNAAAARIYGYSRLEMMGQPLSRLFPPECLREEQATSDRVVRTRQVEQYEAMRVRKDGQRIHVAVTLSPIINSEAKVIAVSRMVRDITERKVAEAALETAQRRLVEASRHAGKAEVATNVLHNVGNVLNSVNISAELIAGHFQSPVAEKLARVSALLAEHAGDPPGYLCDDPQGRQIPGYLGLLAKSLHEDHAATQAELTTLRRNIDHIRQVIAVQQQHGRRDVSETISAAEVLEDALRINAASLERHHVRLKRECDEEILLVEGKHQILQILVNLIRNAKDALAPTPASDRQITLRLERSEMGSVRFSVIDNGVGIAPEHLARLFEHGFTTRPDGHGFGLHSAALLAKELGGGLQAISEGPGRGATFHLKIPLTLPVQQ